MFQWNNVGGPTWIYNTGYDAVHDVLYAGLYGWGGGSGYDPHDGGVWAYDGTSWTDITDGMALDTDIIWTLLYVPEHDLLYVGTYSGGVWSYDRNTDTWINLDGAIADYEVWSLAYDSVHDLLYAGTGNWSPDNGMSQGVWKWDGATWTQVSSIINGVNQLSAEPSSFEGGTVGGWGIYASTCALANSTDWASDGTHSLKITPDPAHAHFWAALDVTAFTTAAADLTISCMFKGISGKQYNLILYDDVAGLQTGTAFTSDGTAQRITWTGQYGAGSTYRQLGITTWHTHTAEQVVYMDDVRIVAGIDVATLSVTYLAFDPNHNILYASPETFYSGMAGVWACADPDTAPVWTQFPDADVDHHHLWVITYDSINNMLYAGAYHNVGSIYPPVGMVRYDGSTWTKIGLPTESIWYLVYDPTFETLYVLTITEGLTCKLWTFENTFWTDVTGDLPVNRIQSIDVSATKILASTWEEGVWTAEYPIPDTPYIPAEATRVTERRPAPPTVELWNADMTERYPNIDKEIQALKFSSILYGGFATCTFELFRKPWVHYPDLALGNIVIVRSRHQIVWYGSIAAPATDTTDLKLSIEADGPVERLKSRLSLVTLGAATKGSAWIITNLIGDSNLNFDAGNIYADDYAYETGIDFTAGVAYSEAVTDINKGNNFRYGFFPPPTSNVMAAESFDFWPISSTPEYYLDMKDCDTKIQYTKDGIENVLYVKYNDGTDHYFWWPHDGGGVAIPDAASVALYDRRDGKLDISGTVTLAEAEHLAQVALDWRKRIRPATDITARKITNVNGATVPNAEVQAGRVLHIRGLNPGEFTLLTAQSLNELCTWPIIMSAPDIDACTVTLSPGGLGNTLDKLLARVEMVKRT